MNAGFIPPYPRKYDECLLAPGEISNIGSGLRYNSDPLYLTFCRSPYFALAYAANDVVLIVLWTLAAVEDISYLSVMICFVIFLINDLYGFVNWKRMEKRQMA